MTVEEFLQRISIRSVTLGELHGKTIEEDLRALIYAETERCAALVSYLGGARGLIGTEQIADELLRTSPGKGDK